MEKQKYQAYASATQTVAATRQIVLLYDGVIRFVKQAKEAILASRIEDRYNLLIKASDVIGGLQGALDFDNGGDVAKILYRYYSDVDMKIFSIHRTNSIETCDEVIADLKQLRDVWEEIDQNIAKQEAETKSGQKPAVDEAHAADISPVALSSEGFTISA